MKGIAIIAMTFGIMLLMGCTSQPSTQTPSVANCSDGTLEKTCSVTKPMYCAGGELLKNAEKCGCPANYTMSNGACLKLCPDGTEAGKCGITKPNFCLDGTLVSDPAKCGCTDSRYDIVNNSCVIKRCLDGTTINNCSSTNTTYSCTPEGILSRDPAKCGCEPGYSLYSGDCWKNCSDGTLEGKCSANDVTKLCSNGTLVTDLNKCSCPTGKISCNNSCKTPACKYNSDCDDGNSLTQDKCLSPGMCNATCSNEYYAAVIYDSDQSPKMHDLRFGINSFDSIGRNLSYTSRNGTDMILSSSSSSKKFIEVSVTIDAIKDYDFEVSQSSFYLIDEHNITYNPVCPSKYNKTTLSTSSCYNDNAFGSYDSLVEGDTADGYLYFEIPKSNDPQYLAFKFDTSLKPGEIWFRYG